MLLQQFDSIFNEHCCSPMDNSISKQQRHYLKHLQQRATGKFHPTLKKQILNKEKSRKDNQKSSDKAKKRVRSLNKLSPLLKRRLLRECIERKAKVVLNKIDDCPDINAVWVYDRSVGRYKWQNFSDVASEEDNRGKDTQAYSDAIPNELSFVITEIRGNASDVFESVCFTSDAETEATLDYSEDNIESDNDLGGVVEIHESYNPVFQGQNITVQIDEGETVEGPLNYEIKPNERNSSVNKDEISDRENSCVNLLDVSLAQNDTIHKGKTKNGRISPFTRKVGGKTKRRRRKRYLQKPVNINKKSTPLYFRKVGGKQKIERKHFTFAKENRTCRIGKHSKRFREILKNAPRYWRSRALLNATKQLVNTDDEKKPAVPLKVRLLRTYRKFPETVNQDKEALNVEGSKAENITTPKRLEETKKPITLCIKRKNSKVSKCPVEDSASSQANSTDGVSTKRKTDKPEISSKDTTSDDGYSLLDQELPGYNWLEKKIKSGEIITPRRTSTGDQEINSTACEATENPEVDPNSPNTKMDKEGITAPHLQDSVKENIPQEETIKPESKAQTQMEVSHSKLKEDNLYSSETKESSEVTSPESGVEIDVAPLSAGDSEGDFLAQGIYLVINEDDINTGNNSFLENADRGSMEKKDSATEQPIEDCNGKVQTLPIEAVSNKMDTRVEQEHICNNEACLLSIPERISIGNRNNTNHSPEFSPPPVSWLKQAIIGEKKSALQKPENEIVATYSPISPSTSGNTSENNHTQEEGTVSIEKQSEFKGTSRTDFSPISNCSNQDSNSLSYNSNQSIASVSKNQKETHIRSQSQESSSFVSHNNANIHGINETRIKMTNHIPVQQISTNTSNAIPKKLESALHHGVPNLFGNLRTIAPAPPADSNKHLSTPQSTPLQIQMTNPMNNYEPNPQGCKDSFLKRSYEQYISPGTWASLHPSQVPYGANFNSAIEPVCQITEHYTANSTLQNEKNFTISSLLELQSASGQSNSGLQSSAKTTIKKSSDVSKNTDIHKSHLRETAADDSNQSSTLRAQLEGNIQRQKLPEHPSSEINEDSADDIKIVYNKLVSYQNQSVSVPSSIQPVRVTKNDVHSLPPSSQAQSPHLTYQEHKTSQRADKVGPEQQIASIPPISLPIIPKPMPIQAPVRPSPVLMAPPIEKVDQQKTYQTPPAESLHPVKRTSPQIGSASPGYQNISSYHAPPKSLREEVEYRKRELMYLDQLARKREKEFERLQNIRKSKIRLLKLLENRIPIALNKDCNAHKTVPYYYCQQGEKSEAWTNQANAQLVPSEKSTSSVMQSTPGTVQVPNICNSYQHYPPPNDRIRYELNHFISSFNTQMQEVRKDKNSISLSRKEHDISFGREPLQNISSAPHMSIPGFGMTQNASIPTTNVARVPPGIGTKNRAMEESSRTILSAANYVEKESNCQAGYTTRTTQPPPPYPIVTDANKYQTSSALQRNYSNCQFQNPSSYNALYTGAPQKMVAPVRMYEQPYISNQQQKNKDDLSRNAQQQHFDNKAWSDQRQKHNIQKLSPYQPEPTIPQSFWPVAHPPPSMFSGSQRLKMQPDIVQQRMDDNSIGLVFVDASKTSHVCSFCNGNAIFLCSSCKKAWYCGRECQRRSWAQHSNICVAD